MSLRTASCPGCGATLEFKNAATLVVVCPFCASASYRSDVDLQLLGKVADVTPIASVLDVGTVGRHGGVGWTCVGQIQLDHGAGPWNEWCLLYDDGRWAWLAEAQGELLLTEKKETEAPPPLVDLEPGSDVDLGAAGQYVVAEVGEGKVTAVRGELPARVVPGDVVHYADLRGPGRAFGTLDFGAGTDSCEAVYLGRIVMAADMGLKEEDAKAPERRAEAERISCPKCAGVVELRDPDSVRVVCGNCGALLSRDEKAVKMLGIAADLKSKPAIPLGATGTLCGERVEVLAYLVRSVRVDEIRYPWREYLLMASTGYRWLVESQGHWSLVRSLPLGDAKREGLTVWTGGKRFRHFQGGEARVDYVLGEVYWEVEVGETVRYDDYVAPPDLVSVEKSGKEIVASVGFYVTPEEVQTAFALPVALHEPVGVAPAQPNPYDGRVGAYWGVGLAMVVLLFVLMGLVSSAVGGDQAGVVFPGLLIGIALLVPPIVVTSRRSSFETRRWEDSDHPIGGGGGGGDDDDDDE